jgi:ubiquitin C-terminal hydrolase
VPDLDIEWMKYLTDHPSIIDRLFTGRYFHCNLAIGMQKTVVVCGKCSHNSITYNPFMTLSVACESSLEGAIKTYLREETIDNKEKYFCEQCKKKVKAKIRHDLSLLPEILVFHIKRFSYPSLKKIKKLVKFPPVLRMA